MTSKLPRENFSELIELAQKREPKKKGTEIKPRLCKFSHALSVQMETNCDFSAEESFSNSEWSKERKILIKIFGSAPKNLKTKRNKTCFNIASHQQHIEGTSSIHCVKIKTLFHSPSSLISLAFFSLRLFDEPTSISNWWLLLVARSHIRIMAKDLNVFIQLQKHNFQRKSPTQRQWVFVSCAKQKLR